MRLISTEAEFLDDPIGTTVFRVFLLAIHSHLYSFTPPPPPPRAKVVCNSQQVCYFNIVYANLKSENSQDYAQKPQRNRTFMNPSSENKLLVKVLILADT
jgi:hypothetical protein